MAWARDAAHSVEWYCHPHNVTQSTKGKIIDCANLQGICRLYYCQIIIWIRVQPNNTQRCSEGDSYLDFIAVFKTSWATAASISHPFFAREGVKLTWAYYPHGKSSCSSSHSQKPGIWYSCLVSCSFKLENDTYYMGIVNCCSVLYS
jgi:hypothetical protein